jgi:hypothetical protein
MRSLAGGGSLLRVISAQDFRSVQTPMTVLVDQSIDIPTKSICSGGSWSGADECPSSVKEATMIIPIKRWVVKCLMRIKCSIYKN